VLFQKHRFFIGKDDVDHLTIISKCRVLFCGGYTYCAASFILTGPLVLTGTGVWVFKSGADIVTSPGSSVTGGDPCNIWWRVVSSVTLDTTTVFEGNILASTAISMKNGATLNGRAFAQTAAVTLIGNTITLPTCTAAAAPTVTPSIIPPLINVRKVPSPLALPAGPGSVTYTYTVTNPGRITMTDITLTDDKCSNVTYMSGDTNNNGWLETNEVWIYKCTTNLAQTTVNYATARGLGNGMASVDTASAEVVVGVPVVPPLIHLVKTPDPLALPFGGGSIVYNYTVTNPGTVALSNVTLTDNKCSSVKFISGDTNGDSKLQSTETWKYTCTINVPVTTTNTAIAIGHANGLIAVDTALATVVVAGLPVPPLIHILKIADPVILPVGGGPVTYTYTVTNPGTVTLSNVSVNDDKCSDPGLTLASGDVNGNGLMETNETWTYICKQNLKVTTTNTATAIGHANDLTVTDIAIASVVVAPFLIPKLPNTGVAPMNSLIALTVGAAGVFVAVMLMLAITKRKRLF